MSNNFKTIFDVVNGVTNLKIHPENLTPSDKKLVTPYMLNRILSMNMKYVELVNEFQRYTITLPGPSIYRVYFDFLPKEKNWAKYIKGGKENATNKELVAFLSGVFQIGDREAEEYLTLLYELPSGISEIINEMKKRGYDEKRIGRIFGKNQKNELDN